MDLSPSAIPELDELVIRRKSAVDPHLRSHARSILKAKGRLRTARHPFLFEHRWRLCLTDRWHQLLGKKSHKRATCQQHLTCLIRTLTHDQTSFMEAVNARQRKRLRTICTADPMHVIPFYHKVMYWQNRKIIRRQEQLLEKCCRPGEVIGEDELFRFAIMVCARCRRPGHVSSVCQDADGEADGEGHSEGVLGEAPSNVRAAQGVEGGVEYGLPMLAMLAASEEALSNATGYGGGVEGGVDGVTMEDDVTMEEDGVLVEDVQEQVMRHNVLEAINELTGCENPVLEALF
jgi:hypothetical protein